MVYGTYNELVIGANLNQLITRGPHIVKIWGWVKTYYDSPKKMVELGVWHQKKKHIDDISPKFDADENFLETPGFE